MRAYTNPQQNKSQKMLASTVQFSTTNQTPVTRPHQTPTARTRTQRYEEQTGPDTKKRFHSLRTQQRAYEPDHRTPSSGPHTPQRDAVLGARDTGRPNWSAFHPRALSQTPADAR